MSRMEAALTRYDADRRVRYLRCGLSGHLADPFGEAVPAGEVDLGQQPAASVGWKGTTHPEISFEGERPAFAFLAKPVVLHRDEDRRRKAVVELDHVDVVRSHIGHPERRLARSLP